MTISRFQMIEEGICHCSMFICHLEKRGQTRQTPFSGVY
jgi:hypothetical protein